VTYTSRFAATYGKAFDTLAATSDSLLADKQGAWLAENAQATVPAKPHTATSVKNWVRVNASQAQSYANQGYLALVVYGNPNPASPGHIAVIASNQPEAAIGDYPNKNTPYMSLAVDGPYIAQSGGFNSSYTTVSRGFAPPDGVSDQWFGADSSRNLVKFYVYYMPVDWDAIVMPSTKPAEGYQSPYRITYKFSEADLAFYFNTSPKIPFRTVPIIADAYRMLDQKQIDAAVFTAPILEYYAAHAGSSKAVVVGTTFAHESLGMAVPIGSPYVKPSMSGF